MRIIVCVKQVVDLEQVKMNPANRKPVLDGVPLCVGQIEKNALEEAALYKESNEAEVVVLTVGPELAEDVTLESAARAGDRVVTVEDPGLKDVSSAGIAAIIAKAIEKIGDYDLVLFGEGSTDNNSGQVGPLVAQLLQKPLVTYAKQMEISADKVKATLSYEDYFETVEVGLPAVVTVTSEINEPRIPSIIDIMDASSKPIENLTLADIGISADEVNKNASVMISNQYPEQVRKGVVIEGESLDDKIAKLLENLKKEGVLDS